MILAKRVSAGRKELLDHAAGLWSGATGGKVSLVAAPVALQPSKYIQGKWKDGQFGQVKEVYCQALHNGSEIAFRLEWAASKPSRGGIDNAEFADGAALLFPLTKDAPLVMGAPGAPVNIWHWRADKTVAAKSNLSTGIGTSQVIEEGDILISARHANGRWSVVFARKMPGGENAAGFAPGAKVNAAFAIWQGSNAERGGLKAFSPDWLTVELAA